MSDIAWLALIVFAVAFWKAMNWNSNRMMAIEKQWYVERYGPDTPDGGTHYPGPS